MELHKPEHLRDIVGRVKAMPKGTDHEYVELVERLVFDVGSIVNRLSQPFLHRYIPVVYLVPYVYRSLKDPGFDRVYPIESLTVIAHT